ncbi:MAG: hypothetical protein SFV51_21485 [Bryobacteraceae bacterium]|nr:hypothetical protein [Bryobacteraceae bacterium]
MLADLFSLLLGCIPIYMAKAPGSFRLTVLAGVVLAGLCWYLSSVYTRMWNKKFRITATHHFLCGFASVCTLLFTILFASLYYTRDAALISIGAWQLQLNNDAIWAERTFSKAYEKVKDLGTEDFSNAPPPGSPNSFIPTNSDESRQTAAAMYSNEACKHFDQKRPFLSKVVWSSPGVPSEVVFEDVKHWHETNPNYPPSRAIEIAANQIKQGLQPQAPRVIYLSRLAVAALFLLIQAIPFGLIGWAAYRDIRAQL